MVKKPKHPCKGKEYEVFRDVIIPTYIEDIIEDIIVNSNRSNYERIFNINGIAYKMFCYENTYNEMVLRFTNENESAYDRDTFSIYGNHKYIRLYFDRQKYTIEYPLEEGIFEQLKFAYDFGNLDFKTVIHLKDIFCNFYINFNEMD